MMDTDSVLRILPVSLLLVAVLPRAHAFSASTSSPPPAGSGTTVVDPSSVMAPLEAKPRPLLQNWWPVSLESALDPDKPNAIELLNKKLVLFHDGQEWKCLDDRCVHRFAPLSEGRLVVGDGDSSDKCLQCSYHGWEFDGDGACQKIPQLSPLKKDARGRVASYPVRKGAEMLWVWSDPSTWAAAYNVSLPISPLMEEYIKEYPESGFMRDLPYGLELLGENLLDISHLPFSHHSVGGFCREDARPLQLRALSKKERLQSIKQEAEAVDIHEDLQLSNRNYSAPVFQVEVQNASLSDPTFMARNRTRQVEANSTATSGFYDPCHIRYRRVFGGRSGANIELFLCPTASGKSRVFFFNTFERALKRNMDEAVNAQKDWFGRMKQRFINSRIRILVGGSEWHGHMVAHDIFDGDGIFLNKQGDRMNRDGLTYKDYFIPTTADVLVKNYRRWLDSAAEITLTRYGKEGMAAVASATGTVADPSGQPAYLDRDQREQMLDRYSSHTKNCKICSQALSKLQKNRSTMDVIRTAMLGAVGASSSTLSICFFWPCQEEVLHRLPE